MHANKDLIIALAGAALVFAGRVATSWAVSGTLILIERLLGVLKRRLTRTERAALEWVHYHDRVARTGHKPKHVRDCEDGKCSLVTK